LKHKAQTGGRLLLEHPIVHVYFFKGTKLQNFIGLAKLVTDRATRLGELLPFGRLFTLGSFLKNGNVALILGNWFQVMYSFGQKWDWLPIGRFFNKLIWSPWSSTDTCRSRWVPV
jgi:hypothetical protein